MRYRTILWDWNGTLFNDTQICFEITNDLLEELGHPRVTLDYYRKTLRHPIREFYNEITKGASNGNYSWFADTFHERYEKRRYTCRLHADAEDHITFFREKEARQSILSAHPQNLLDSIVSHLNIAHHFDHVIGAADNLAADKFKEGERVMQLSGAQPSTTLIIGDTEHDAEVAKRLGIDCLLVAQGMQCKTRLQHLKVRVLDSLKEVRKFLESD